jgi:hypothetical protein
MMPPTATYQQIKAYQRAVEKNKITPHSLPLCSRCRVDSKFFKIHAYRERRFLIIVKMIVHKVFCSLVRFKCPGCGKTVVFYPDFAIPHKHYTRQTITGFADAYLEPKTTYKQAPMVDYEAPGYPDLEAALAPSTVHRWVTSLAHMPRTRRAALDLLLQAAVPTPICRDLAAWQPERRKFRSERRKQQLIDCRHLSMLETLFHATFKTSIFTKLATVCGFG